MSYSLATGPSSTPDGAGLADKIHATTLLKLLSDARSQVGRDTGLAQILIDRASALLEAKTDRSRPGSSNGLSSGGLAPWQIRRVRQYVDEHVEQRIELATLSVVAQLSKAYFCKAFKRSFGETPHSYVTRRRVEQARYLMLTTERHLSEIALACGFADQAHFTKTFRLFNKVTPGLWRRESRGAGAGRQAPM
jgi:AraC family transcriptional regulator